MKIEGAARLQSVESKAEVEFTVSDRDGNRVSSSLYSIFTGACPCILSVVCRNCGRVGIRGFCQVKLCGVWL